MNIYRIEEDHIQGSRRITYDVTTNDHEQVLIEKADSVVSAFSLYKHGHIKNFSEVFIGQTEYFEAVRYTYNGDNVIITKIGTFKSSISLPEFKIQFPELFV